MVNEKRIDFNSWANVLFILLLQISRQTLCNDDKQIKENKTNTHTHKIPYLSVATALQKTRQMHVKAPKDEGKSSQTSKPLISDG